MVSARSTLRDILAAAKIEPTTRVKDLTEAEEKRLRDIIDNDYTVEGDLQRLVTNNIKRLKDINAYRSLRHKAGLPTRGQRTHLMLVLVRVAQWQLVEVNLKQRLRRRKGTNRLWPKQLLKLLVKAKRSVPAGQLHIQATFNNTIVSFADKR